LVKEKGGIQFDPEIHFSGKKPPIGPGHIRQFPGGPFSFSLFFIFSISLKNKRLCYGWP
jgi:hypothetical protein